jgi:hypothetical protein
MRWKTIGRAIACLPATAALAGPVAAQSPTTRQPVPLPLPATAQLVEEFRMDGSRADLLLSNIKALLPHASGDLWLVEHSQSTNSMYSSTGALPVIGTSRVVRISGDGAGSVHAVGRDGAGPGEWQLPAGLTGLPDGRVVLFDNAIPNRLTLYKASGALDTTLTLPIRVINVRADTAGLLWVTQPPVMTRTAQGSTATPAGTRILDSRGRDLGAAPEGPRPPASRPPIPIIGSGSKQARLIPPYLGANLLAWGPAGEFVATFGDSGRLIRYPMQRGKSGEPLHGWQLGGQSIDYVRREPRVVVMEQERAEQRARLQEVARLAEARRASIPEIPTQKPYFGGARFDAEGRLWLPVAASSVRLPDADFVDRKIKAPGEVPNRWYEPSVFDVFDREYRPLGRVALPMRASLGNGPISARGNVLWVVLHDADDVPSLVRYRLRWGERRD